MTDTGDLGENKTPDCGTTTLKKSLPLVNGSATTPLLPPPLTPSGNQFTLLMTPPNGLLHPPGTQPPPTLTTGEPQKTIPGQPMNKDPLRPGTTPTLAHGQDPTLPQPDTLTHTEFVTKTKADSY